MKRRFQLTFLPVAIQLILAGCLGADQTGWTRNSAGCEARPRASTPTLDAEIELVVSEADGERTRARIWEPHTECARIGFVFVAGVNGGYEQPVDGIYGRLAEKYSKLGVHSVFVRYRRPHQHNFRHSVEDALAGVRYLRQQGVTYMALIGWSMGGAVTLHAAAETPEVRTIIGFAPQELYSEAVSRLGNRSLLLIHSPNDLNVPYESSRGILDAAPIDAKKRLHSVESIATDPDQHYLDGIAAEVDPVVQAWINEEFGLISTD